MTIDWLKMSTWQDLLGCYQFGRIVLPFTDDSFRSAGDDSFECLCRWIRVATFIWRQRRRRQLVGIYVRVVWFGGKRNSRQTVGSTKLGRTGLRWDWRGSGWKRRRRNLRQHWLAIMLVFSICIGGGFCKLGPRVLTSGQRMNNVNWWVKVAI